MRGLLGALLGATVVRTLQRRRIDTNEVTAAAAELSQAAELRCWLDARTAEQADDELHSMFVAAWPSDASQTN